MKLVIQLTLLLFSTITLDGQNHQPIGALDVKGFVPELSISPDGSIWLTTEAEHTYYTKHFDSLWRTGSLQPPFPANQDIVDFARIDFFNQDTAILTGLMWDTTNPDKDSGACFITQNGGQSWHFKSFGAHSYIYDVETHVNGNVWMGGSEGIIFYSEDYGQHWENRAAPFDHEERVLSIAMDNEQIGFAGARENLLVQTSNNWDTFTRVPTPFDQLPHETFSQTLGQRIEYIDFWQDYLVVCQGGKAFYSKKDKISWFPFSVNLLGLYVESPSNKLYGVTQSRFVVEFTTPSQFTLLNSDPLPVFPIDIQAVNEVLYALDAYGQVFRVTKTGIAKANLYTHHLPKPYPEKRINNGRTLLGIRNHTIYLEDLPSRKWVKKAVVDFEIKDICLRQDSVAVLWNGQENFGYSLRSNKIEPFSVRQPLNDFLEHPVKTLRIQTGTYSCYGMWGERMYYKQNGPGKMTVSYKPDSLENRYPEVDNALLCNVLVKVNDSPEALPKIEDFEITPAEKEEFLELISNRRHGQCLEGFNWATESEIQNHYYSLPKQVDSFSSELLRPTLKSALCPIGMPATWLWMHIVNENQDTVFVEMSEEPLGLPWHFEYKDQHILCYDPSFSRFVLSCLPKHSEARSLLSNAWLMMKVADYQHAQQP